MGAPAGDAAELVNAIAERARHFKTHLGQAWSAVALWKSLMPHFSHIPTSFAVWKARVALACCWDWTLEAFCLCLLFAGMLRPVDLFRLHIRDVLTPSVLLIERPSLYIRVNDPKMRRLTARRDSH